MLGLGGALVFYAHDEGLRGTIQGRAVSILPSAPPPPKPLRNEAGRLAEVVDRGEKDSVTIDKVKGDVQPRPMGY